MLHKKLLHLRKMETVIYRDLGRIDYQKAWDLQTRLLQEAIDRKRANRRLVKEGKEPVHRQEHVLLFCEHPPVFTLGKSGSEDHLLLSQDLLKRRGFDFFKINRGGDITYHGPGQIVGYPIFDLDCFFTDVHRYIRTLEEAVIRTLGEYGIKAVRMPGFTGVWMPAGEGRPQRKICAIGVHLSRWVSMHGFALNVNTDLSHFDYIVPCGIADPDKVVTSMSQELETKLDTEEVKASLRKHFADLFVFRYA
ncbi:MAG: lipoyl(octanoyl) transferase LipB [Saprospiraceae bacterium]|nr:lipoyl(octanoyl) transferase LipB [Saprospiraceae bacterium]